MLYHVSRNGQTYGPYTRADLERYLQSGHILPTDLCKSDAMAEWQPVSAALGLASTPPAASPYPVPEPGPYYPTPAQFDSPPNLHWGLVLLFDLFTFGIFQAVWNLIVAVWMRRVQPNSKALLYYALGYGMGLFYFVLHVPMSLGLMHHQHFRHALGAGLVGLVSWIFRLVARFSLKQSLEEHYNTIEPIDLRLNGFLVFFFGGLYIQSQLNRINDIKQALRYRGAPL